MKKIIYLVGIILLFGCTDNDEENNKILLLRVDYMTYNFESGVELLIPDRITDTDTLSIYVDYKPPGDFGNISLYHEPTNELIFDGSIIWMGTGQIKYPKSFRNESVFANLPENIEKPDDEKFQIIFYNLYNQSVDYSAIWNSISSLEIVSTYLKSNKKIGLFLYTPSVGVGDPYEWDWFVIMNR